MYKIIYTSTHPNTYNSQPIFSNTQNTIQIPKTSKIKREYYLPFKLGTRVKTLDLSNDNLFYLPVAIKHKTINYTPLDFITVGI